MGELKIGRSKRLKFFVETVIHETSTTRRHNAFIAVFKGVAHLIPTPTPTT